MTVFMRKLFAFLLIASMVTPTVPVFSIVDGAWSEELDVSATYEVDTFYMNEVNGAQTSSNAYNKWNQNQNGSMVNMKDPTNAANTIGHYTVEPSKTALLRKNVYMEPIPRDEAIVISQDLKIPAPTADMDTESVRVELLGTEILHLTCNATGGGLLGRFYDKDFGLAYDEWIRVYFIITPSGDGTGVTVKAQLSGNITDGSGAAASYLQASAHLSLTTEDYRVYLKGKGDAKGVVYLDNNCIMKAGGFGAATVLTETYGDDIYRNFNLSGQVMVQLYHMVDLSTFRLSDVRVCNKLSEDIPYTSMKLDYNAQSLILDFSAHKLPKFEEVYVCFGDGVYDLHGNRMTEQTVIFETLGDKDEVPKPREVIQVPANGFVMPDQWNTGYRCDFEELVPLAEKYPEIVANGNVIDEAIARLYHYEFSYFTHTAHINVTATSPVYIHDFYMNGGGFTNGKSGHALKSSRLTIAWGEGENSELDFFSGENLTISHCYVHDVRSDHMKGSSGQIVEFNYFRDGGTRNPGAHADVVQFMGDWSGDKKAGMHSYFYGNRFDAPEMAYDHASNCIFFFKPEPGSVGYVDVQAVGNWFNGAGMTSALTPGCDKSLNQQIHYTDNLWGYGYRFGVMSYDGEWLPMYGGSYENNGFVTTLQTGSVVYYDVVNGNAQRVYAATDIVGTEARIMVNFANYMTNARGYTIEVEVLNREGEVVASAEQSGVIRRYTPVSEYYTAENFRDTGIRVGDDIIYELIEKPDFPHDVPEYVDITNLPADMEGHTISVKVYDTTEGKALIRTSALEMDVYDHTRPAQPDEGDTYYSVTFKDEFGNVLAIQSVKAGEDAILPEAPRKEGYVFVGWSGSVTNVQGHLTVTAQYQVEEIVFYTVVFVDREGNVLSTQSVRKGAAATAPTPPDLSGYEFVGWSADISSITSDLEIVAQYQKIDTRSQELQAFHRAVDAVSSAQNQSFALRLAKIQEAYAKWLLVDETEEGAEEVYFTFEALVLMYNRDVERCNQAMLEGEHVSQITTKCQLP